MPNTPAPSQPRQLQYLPLDQLAPATRNPKAHDLQGIEGSATRLGWLEPQLLDERTGRLIAGHGRLETLQAMRTAGKDAPEGVVVEGDTWLVPVVTGWRSATDAEAEAAIIALNRFVERGGWDTDMLTAMLDDMVSALDAPLELVGFTADELDDLIGGLELPEQPTEASHAAPTPRGEAAPPREQQGLREVGLMLTDEQHREYQASLAQLKARYGMDAAPLVVLRAMAEALQQ